MSVLPAKLRSARHSLRSKVSLALLFAVAVCTVFLVLMGAGARLRAQEEPDSSQGDAPYVVYLPSIGKPKPFPPPINLATAGTRIDVAYMHACGLTGAGGVKCWGFSEKGELGDGLNKTTNRPVNVTGLSSGVHALSVGLADHTCALLKNGTVQCWGYNEWGQLGNGFLGYEKTPVVATGINNATAVSAGLYSTCALLADATVSCWGHNGGGRLGTGDTRNRAMPTPVIGLAGPVRMISVGGVACALLEDERVQCWGPNNYGQLGNGGSAASTTPVFVSGLSGVKYISVGVSHACALLNSGAVRCWGEGSDGGLGNGATTVQRTPVAVSGIPGSAQAIHAGVSTGCAMTFDGALWCWGANTFGKLGNGGTEKALVPTRVEGIGGDVVAFSIGWNSGCALLSTGKAQCWGDGSVGELGNGTYVTSYTPVNVLDFP